MLSGVRPQVSDQMPHQEAEVLGESVSRGLV